MQPLVHRFDASESDLADEALFDAMPLLEPSQMVRGTEIATDPTTLRPLPTRPRPNSQWAEVQATLIAICASPWAQGAGMVINGGFVLMSVLLLLRGQSAMGWFGVIFWSPFFAGCAHALLRRYRIADRSVRVSASRPYR